ncbi:MAG: hypothetical protein AAF483_17880 [Planctomycetota bacterium]
MIHRLKCFWAKRVIDRADDLDRELPSWVQQLIQSDAELAEFSRSRAALLEQLRSDSAHWGKLLFPTENAASESFSVEQTDELDYPVGLLSRDSQPQLRKSYRGMVAAAVALSACIALTAFFVTRPANEGAFSEDLASGGSVFEGPPSESPLEETDLRPFVATANASEKVARKISDGANRYWKKMSEKVPLNEEADPSAIVENTKENLRNTGGTVRSAIRQWASRLDSGYSMQRP